MTKHPFFPPDALKFLSDLDKHNDRAWFEEHKERYERSLREPYLRFLEALGPRLEKLSPRFVVDASPTGGSLARIHRDMRFVRDGKPYKTALSAHFTHDKAKAGAVPSFYVVIAPGKSFVAGGLREPDRVAVKKLKEAIANDEARWRRLTLTLAPERFVAKLPLDDADVLGPDLVGEVTGRIRKLLPFVAFVSAAAGTKL